VLLQPALRMAHGGSELTFILHGTHYIAQGKVGSGAPDTNGSHNVLVGYVAVGQGGQHCSALRCYQVSKG
jgi:hypothetical protein